ncbi:MAG: DUF177 domain-containing protein [Magnetococcales bacterium]|nr:DUF177 domain-containing protein [Magnetococcales bacterium]
MEPSLRDLSGVTLELATLSTRSAMWTAHGMMPPAALQELATVGVVEEPVEVQVVASPIWQEEKLRVRVQGECRGNIRLACSRCLIEFNLPIDAEIDAFYAPGKDPAIKNKRWQFEEDVVFIPDGMLKLKHLVEEELLLALPMNPICVSGCAGLCAGCGADLNRAPCSCRKATPTGPFAVLKKLQSY